MPEKTIREMEELINSQVESTEEMICPSSLKEIYNFGYCFLIVDY